jgi:glycosyltransferase involved in cell wall biosynthesis
MKILVFGHHLELGGSQFNSVELSATLERDHGHKVIVFAAPGPAVDLVHERGLSYVAAPRGRVHPSPAVMRAVRRLVAEHRVDIVHAWEWAQCLEAFYALQLPRQLPVVGTDMSMEVTRFLPRCLPITYGTPALVEEARRLHTGPVELLEPPVDTERNHPTAVDSTEFKTWHGLDDGHFNVVIVSRLTSWLKLEGLERSMDAVAALARKCPVRLVVVGGGTAFDRLAARAARINARLGRRVVVLTGPMTDPRPAYAAADLVLGMGSSVLRGMAFAKPCIVLGEKGFSEPFNPHTSPRFLWEGFYGLGNGERSVDRLSAQIAELLERLDKLPELGAFGRMVVEERFSLEVGAATLDAFYRSAADHAVSWPRAAAEGVRSALYRSASAFLPDGVRRQVTRRGLIRP